VKHASLTTANKTPNVRVKINSQDHIFKAADIAMITEARVDELFEYVNKELTRIHKAHKLPGGVVLVGGTAKLPGIAEFAKEKMQLPARVGKLQLVSGLVDTVADPSYAASVGLMMLDMLLAPQDHSVTNGTASARALNFVDSLWSKIKK
jgi:cell division protein FtsA